MDKILELLGADKLNEDTQAQLKDKLTAIIEIEAKKQLESSLDEEKTNLIEEYEAKFKSLLKKASFTMILLNSLKFELVLTKVFWTKKLKDF